MAGISEALTIGNAVNDADSTIDQIDALSGNDGTAAFTPSNPFFDLSTLNGTNGFTINGFAAGDRSGGSVSRAGDVNGDGIGDFIINEVSLGISGQSYVVFGKSTGFPPTFNLSTLDGRNGFILRNATIADVRSRITAKGAGDVNGDGIDDLIVSDFIPNPTNTSVVGKSYVVFGRSTGLPKTLNVSTLNGRNGFAIKEAGAKGTLSRASVSGAGDVNGDGVDDLIIGVPDADGGAGQLSGKVYVVNGRKTGFPATLTVSTSGASSDSAFALLGAKSDDRFGTSVSSAGDVNGDGFADLIIGAPRADGNGEINAGQTYVVFGGNGIRRPVSSISFTPGKLTINGIAVDDLSGSSVSGAGDINGDGIDDLIIGAPRADANDTDSGQSYIVFGSKTGLPDTLNLSALNGNNGFAIDGIAGRDRLGESVSGAGDVNGDGIDDLIIGAPGVGLNGNINSGQSYLIFGSNTGFPASLTPTTLNGNNGFVFNGIGDEGNNSAIGDFSGFSVSSAGDVNGDGIDDLIIGAPGADANGGDSGQSYVIFGQRTASLSTPQTLIGEDLTESQSFFNPIQIESADATTSEATIVGTPDNDLNLNGDQGGIAEDDVILGLSGNDVLRGLAGDDILIGDSGNDSLEGGVGNDILLGRIGNDTLAGNEGNDSIYAGAGDDRIIWNHRNYNSPVADGNDSIDGGISTDVMEITIDDIPSTMNIFSLNGTNVVVFEQDKPSSSLIRVDNVELFEVTSIRGDTIFEIGDLTGSDITRVTFNGSSSTDDLRGSTTNTPLLVHGRTGDDLLRGGSGNDTLYGDQGNDTLYGGGGNDRFIWNEGDGNDFIDGNDGRENPVGSDSDVVEVNGSNSSLTGDFFTLELNPITPTSVDPDDVIFQRTNLQTFNLSVDNVRQFEVNGNAGDDWLEVKPFNGRVSQVTFNGGEGNDNLNLLNANANVRLVALGGTDNDALRGGTQGDSLLGEDGNDTLLGRDGNDEFLGGTGDDTLIGGNGFDRFGFRSNVVFNSTAIVGDANDFDPNLGVDRINDFGAGDRIYLDNTTFSALLINGSGIAPEQFTTVTQDSLAATSDHFIVYSLGSGRLFYNTDGADVSGNDGFGTGGLFAIVDNDSNAATLPPVLTTSSFAIVA